jgi:RimJ/RimL family protein N-acetyltransferase
LPAVFERFGDPCPPLRADRLTLEPLTAAHAADLFVLLADAEVWRYEDIDPPRSVGELQRQFARWETRLGPDEETLWLNWAVRVPSVGLIGSVQATVDGTLWEAWIAYTIGRRFWSQGFGTEAMRAVVAHLRGAVGVRSLRATVDERNVASTRLLEKLGFALVDAGDPRNLLYAVTFAATGADVR